LAEVCVTLLFVTGAIGSAANTDPTPYSKFSPDSKSPAGKTGVSKEASGVNLPSRVGMGMIYGLGTVASAVAMGSMAFAKHNSSGIGQGLVEVLADAVTLRSAGAMGAVASLLHFGKRELEVLFVHKYSGSMPAQSALFISAIYGIVGWALSHFASRSGLDEADAASPGGMTRRAVGASLFVAGMAINAYHHVLLARLRKPGSTKRYVVPQGGLFPLIACPHYLGEIIQWLGCAVALPTPMHIGWMLQGLAYLGTRAASTTAYYREKLGDEYPRDRKHLIPWLY
jgi:very-long-chain enoyl-CoA reductase